MQGVCDARGKCIAVTCKHVGSTNDIQALFETSNLIELNICHQHPYHWVGDAIYTDTRTLMSPYPGVNLHETDPSKESFNFILSQLRITIERVFGMFVQRFGILWRPSKFELKFIMEIVHACCRLHNFLVDMRSPAMDNFEVTLAYPRARLREDGTLADDSWRNVPQETWKPSSGSLLRRDAHFEYGDLQTLYIESTLC
jgi:hypothetical protein